MVVVVVVVVVVVDDVLVVDACGFAESGYKYSNPTALPTSITTTIPITVKIVPVLAINILALRGRFPLQGI